MTSSIKRRLKVSLLNQRGDFALNGALLLLLIFAVCVLMVSVIGTGYQSMKLHSVASKVLRYAEVQGAVTPEVYAELDRLAGLAGLEVRGDISGAFLGDGQRVQFGSEMVVHLEYDTSFGLGGVISFPLTLEATVSGRSEVYWK